MIGFMFFRSDAGEVLNGLFLLLLGLLLGVGCGLLFQFVSDGLLFLSRLLLGDSLEQLLSFSELLDLLVDLLRRRGGQES